MLKNPNLEGLIIGCQNHKKTRMKKLDQDSKKGHQEPCCHVFQTSREGDHCYGGQAFWAPARKQHYGQRSQTIQASTRDQHYGQRGQTIKGSIRDQHYGQRGQTIKGYIRDQQYGQRVLPVKEPHFGQRGKTNRGTNSQGEKAREKRQTKWSFKTPPSNNVYK